MAVLYITEYQRFGKDESGHTIPAPYTPPTASQTAAIGVSSVNSSAFNDQTRLVELHCDVICHIAWTTADNVKAGTQTAATTSLKRLPADTTQFFTVQPGATVAVIQGT